MSRTLPGIIVLLITGLVLAPGQAGAAVFNVSDVPGFIAALATAETNGEDDTINVAAGTYNVNTLNLLTYSSSEENSLAIIGAGAATTHIVGSFTPFSRGADLRIFATGSTGVVTVQDLTFSKGRSDDGGGGLYLWNAGEIVVEDCVFDDNMAHNLADAGGLKIIGGTGPITIRNNTFANNEARFDAGGMYVGGFNTTVTVEGNLFMDNYVTASGGDGAGAVVVAGTGFITNNVFDGNYGASDGGGLALSGKTATVAGNVFVGNTALQWGSAAIIGLSTPGTLTFTNNTVTGNGDGLSENDRAVRVSVPSFAHIYNNILWGNQSFVADLGVFGSGCCVNLYHNDIGVSEFDPGKSVTDVGNISQDPLFVDAASGDLHLQEGSPGIDGGTNAAPGLPDTDVEGSVRVQGAAVDMGAYEAEGVIVLLPDITVTDSIAPAGDHQMPFGQLGVGEFSDQIVTVTNDGLGDLTIGDIGVASPLDPPFSIVAGQDNCSGQTLAAEASCTLTVRFQPSGPGASFDFFDIPSDDADEPTVNIQVSGSGPAPDITVTDSITPDNDLQMPFGAVNVPEHSDHTVTITNDGTWPLGIGQIAQSNPLAPPFGIVAGQDNCSNQTLAIGATCTLTVRFEPSASGYVTDSFDIPSDDPDEGTLWMYVNGTGVFTDPVPDIKVNGLDDVPPIGTGDAVSITVSLAAGSLAGTDADWWLVADTPFGFYRYNLAGNQWVPGLAPTRQGPIVDVPLMGLPEVPGLPVGSYTFHFGVDTVRNGSVDFDDLFDDSVGLAVQSLP